MIRKKAVILLTTIWTMIWLLTPMTVTAQSTVHSEIQSITTSATAQGDINADGAVDMLDVLIVFNALNGRTELSAERHALADINENGKVDLHDAMYVFYYAMRRMPSQTTTTTTQTTTTTTTTTKKTTTTTKKTTTTVKTTVSTTAPTTPTSIYGIDVSYAQGSIDWVKVQKSGVKFAILRCGYGQDQTDQDDEYFEENAAACEKLGIPYGAYLFCYARSVEEARGEAQHALRLLKGKNLQLPIFLDMEYSSYQGDLTNAEYAAIAECFCTTLSKAGYKVGVYANVSWWENKLTAPCFDKWYRWVAQYYDECEYDGIVHFWQYTSSGKVPGITENTTDLNYCYVNLKAFT